MDNALQALLSWQFILFCLGIFAITFVLRKIAEYVLDNTKVPMSKGSKIWTELLLPIAPLVNGCILAYFAKSYQFPLNLNDTLSRIIFGIVAGLLSGLIYKVVKGLIKDKLPQKVADQLPPSSS